MDSKELMVGDWVLMKDKPYKVASLPSIGNPELESDKYIFHCLKDEIVPIPLTPEILEKNGFENDFYHDESVADYCFIRLEGYSYREDFVLVTWCNGELNVVNDLIGEVKIHCENVHELQHSLRLCGIDKEIEIL